MAQLSEIQKFYFDKTIFLTGATGFVGKLTLEKLLRACPGIRHVYILVRVKKEKCQTERLSKLFECAIFDDLKRAHFDFGEKISVINGDLVQPELGLSEDDKRIIIEEVDIIIHCAATVRFDQTLRQATKINLIATMDLLNIAKKINQLKSLVYVSTAYSNCDRKDIGEVIYEPRIEGSKFVQTVEALSDELLLELQPRFLGKLPNTYTLTKQIVENVLKQEAQTLPVCIVRPSMILAVANEPLQGFIDNIYGPTGFSLGFALGLFRVMLIDLKKKADVVPADFVVNHILAAAWYTGTKRSSRAPKDPEVFNLVSGVDNPMTWGYYVKSVANSGFKYPSKQVVWYPVQLFVTNKYVFLILHVLLHKIPAYIVDTIARIIGKEPGLLKIYAKFEHAVRHINYFSTREWNFQNLNTKKLLEKMSAQDRELFNFELKSVDWQDYMVFHIKALRLYILGETPDTIEEAHARLRKLKVMHCIVGFLLLVLNYYFFKTLLGFLY